MDCTIIRLYLEAYERGQLEEQQRQGIREHLDICQECQRELEEIHRVNVLLEDIEIPPLPIDFTNRVMESIQKSQGGIQKKEHWWRDLRKWGASFVAAGLIMLLLNYSSSEINFATLSTNMDKNPIRISKIMKYSPGNLFLKGLNQLELLKENIANWR